MAFKAGGSQVMMRSTCSQMQEERSNDEVNMFTGNGDKVKAEAIGVFCLKLKFGFCLQLS